MALYVGILDLADGLDAILLGSGELLTIYFDRSARENQYLVAAMNSGQVPTGLTLVGYGSPPSGVPEPSTPLLLVAGLALLARRNRQEGYKGQAR
jgi:hypothetical protein